MNQFIKHQNDFEHRHNNLTERIFCRGSISNLNSKLNVFYIFFIRKILRMRQIEAIFIFQSALYNLWKHTYYNKIRNLHCYRLTLWRDLGSCNKSDERSPNNLSERELTTYTTEKTLHCRVSRASCFVMCFTLSCASLCHVFHFVMCFTLVEWFGVRPRRSG